MGIAQTLLGWIPDWVGFTLIILAGAVSIVVGAIQTDAGFIAFGVAAVASAIIAWVTGATSKPKVGISNRSFGGTVERISTVPWLVIFGLFVVAVIIGAATRP
jgi:hypothetical protein